MDINYKLNLINEGNGKADVLIWVIRQSSFTDTDPKIEQIQIELMRQAPPWRKLYLVAQLNETIRQLSLSGLSQRYPQATPEELHRRLADLLLGAELAAQVYGPLPEEAK